MKTVAMEKLLAVIFLLFKLTEESCGPIENICSCRDRRYYIQTYFTGNWFNAYQYCRNHGMTLATILSEEEQSNMEETAQCFAKGGLVSEYWIGCYGLAGGANWTWSGTGSLLRYGLLEDSGSGLCCIYSTVNPMAWLRRDCKKDLAHWICTI